MRYGLSVRTEPAAEPVTLADAKAHLRVDVEDDDAYIDALIAAARRRAEALCNRSFISTGWTMTLDAFPTTIYLPRSPVISVDAIRYIDDAGDQQTLATSEYRTDLAMRQGRIVPAYGETWPTTRPVINAVEVDFTAGWGTSGSNVPEEIRQAILILIATWFDPGRYAIQSGSAPGKVPMSVQWMLGPHRSWP